MKIRNVVGAIFLIMISTVFTQNFASTAYAHEDQVDSSHYQVSNWDPPSDDFGWVDECFSDYHSILQCALRSGYNPIDAANGYKFDVDSECCKVLKEFDEDCVSDSPRFDDLSYSFSWMRDSCRRHHHHHHRGHRPRRHSPPSPHSPSPKLTPPPSTPSPPSPTPTPPSSTPTPPASPTPPPTPSPPCP